MLLKKTALATMIALSLTACRSHHHHHNIDRATQDKIKQSYESAQKATKEANEAKKLAQTSLSEVNRLKNDAQKSLNEANQVKQLAEKALAQANATKAEAEKILADKNATSSEKENAEALLAQTKKLIKEINKKSSDLYSLAFNAGLSNKNATKFVDEYLEASIQEAENALPALVKAQQEQIQKEQEAIEKKRNELTELAKQNGLADWIANNFAYANVDKSDDEAKSNLTKLVEIKKLAEEAGLENSKNFINNYLYNKNYDIEAAKSEINKHTELKNLAQTAGFTDWRLNNFISNYINKDISEAKNYLAQRENFKNRAKEAGLNDDEINNLIFNYYDNNSDSQYAENELNRIKENKLVETKRQENREVLMELAKEAGFNENNYKMSNFLSKFEYKDISEAKSYLAKRDKQIKLAMSYGFDKYKSLSLLNDELDEEKLQVNIKNEIEERKFYSLYELKNSELGLHRNLLVKEIEHFENNGDPTGQKKREYYDIYNQKYSVVIGKYESTPSKQYYYDGVNISESWGKTENYGIGDNYYYSGVKGLNTPVDRLPSEGSATYQGKAFNMKSDGDFVYNVNFSERTGSGNITGLDVGNINLEKGEIRTPYNSSAVIESSLSVDGNQDLTGNYNLSFFGPNAEEIAGRAILKEQQYSAGSCSSDGGTCYYPQYTIEKQTGAIGFGGTRGEIQK